MEYGKITLEVLSMNWKPTLIQGYEVSDTGLVRSVGKNKHEKILKPMLNKKGYEVVYLSDPAKEGYKTTMLVHRLVAQTYLLNPEDKPQINHKDGNKQNNFVENLEWVTNLENHMHKLEHSLYPESHLPKRVGKFTLDGQLLETFDSIYAAGKSIGKNQYAVSRVVNGLRKSAGGFVWQYVENV
jgi:hypothetical protein